MILAWWTRATRGAGLIYICNIISTLALFADMLPGCYYCYYIIELKYIGEREREKV